MVDAVPLSIRQLRKRFGQHEVLHGVDLTVEQNAIHGLVGLNGAGKTTTLSCLLGLLPFDHGDISILGLKPSLLHRSHGKVAVVFDEPCLHPNLTVGDALRFAQITSSKTTANNGITDIARLEQLLSIERYHRFKVRQLSLGNRRRAAIAQALVGNPEFIVLDEPFNGLDAGGVDDVLTLIQQLNSERGITFLLASHQLSYLERICTHMAILHRGTMAVSDAIDNLLHTKNTQVILQTSDNERARQTLSEIAGVKILTGAAEQRIICELDALSAAELNRALHEAQIDVSELIPQRASLESLFHQITGSTTVQSTITESDLTKNDEVACV